MILPLGDQPNPRGTPWVNYLLMAANIAVFILITLPLMGQAPDPNDPAARYLLDEVLRQNPGLDPFRLAREVLGSLSAYDLFLMRWGYRPAEPQLVTLLTSMFLHGGWMHLIGNMLFLWIYGDNVEHRLGKLGYLVGYLLTGAAAAGLYGLFVPASSGNTPMVGASGAISGVLGFYFIWFPRNQVRLFVLLFPIFFDIWLVNARIVLGFYLLIENLLPFLTSSQEGGGVAYGAHIGGFVAGLVLALGLNLWFDWRCQRSARGCLEPDEDGLPEDPSQAILRRLDENDAQGAGRIFAALGPAQRRALPVPVVVRLAEWLASGERPDAALGLYSALLHDHPKGPHLDQIFLGMGLLLLHRLGRPTAAYQYLQDALSANPSPEVRARALQALAQIAQMQKFQVRSRRSSN